MFSLKYNLFFQECCLARSSLISGLNAILKSNITDTDKGNFYVGLFQLSIGIERLLKLSIIMDYICQNDLNMISGNILKNKYGHGLIDLYSACNVMSKNYDNVSAFISTDELMYNTLTVLDSFAKKARYFNIDTIADSRAGIDPLNAWVENVIMPIIQEKISSSIKEKLSSKIITYLDANFGNGYTYQLDHRGQIMTRFDVIYYAELIKKANPIINWHIIKLLKPIYDILFEISNQIDEKYFENEKRNDIPYVYEFFPFLLLDRSSVIKRKKWV